MRPVSLLPLLAGLTMACAPVDAELNGTALHAEPGLALEGVGTTATALTRQPRAPYRGANWGFRLELGTVHAEAPLLGVYPQRVLVEVEDDWAALPHQSWDEVREIRYTERQRWDGIWQGDMHAGELTHLTINLEEDAYVTVDDLSYDVAIPSDQREIDVELFLDTRHPRPLVVTVMLDVQARDGEVTIVHDGLLIREIDGTGHPHDYRPPEADQARSSP